MKTIGVTCPKCKDGDVVERKSKKKDFSMVVQTILNVTLFLGTNL